VRQLVLQLRRGEGRVEGREDAAAGDREEERRQLGAVRQHRRAARRPPEAERRRREALDHLPQPAVGQRRAAVHTGKGHVVGAGDKVEEGVVGPEGEGLLGAELLGQGQAGHVPRHRARRSFFFFFF
jgi:hypothetical protein